MKSLFKRITSMLLAVSMMLSLGISMPKEINRTAEAATQNVANGMYYIKNSYSETYLEASGLARAKAQEGTNASLRQIWKITHVTDGYYSIRPLSNLETCLTVNYPSVSVGECSTADTSSALGIEEMWWFDGDVDYCKIKPYFSSFRTYPIGLSGSHDGANLMFNAGSSFDYWELEAVSNRSGIYIDNTEIYNDETSTLWVSVNTPVELRMYAYSPTSNDTSVSIIIEDMYYGSVNENILTSYNSGVTNMQIYSGVNSSICKEITLNVDSFSGGIYYMRTVANDERYVKSVASGNVPYVVKNTTTVSGSKEFKWKFEIQDDGSYAIRSVSNGKYLTVSTPSNVVGRNITMSNYTGASEQRWYVNILNNGSYKLVPKCVGNLNICLGVDTTASYILTEGNLSYNDQKWELIKAQYTIWGNMNPYMTSEKEGYIFESLDMLENVYNAEFGGEVQVVAPILEVRTVTSDMYCQRPTACAPAECGTNCNDHHKNLDNVLDSLYFAEGRDYNQINVYWTDASLNVYCMGPNHTLMTNPEMYAYSRGQDPAMLMLIDSTVTNTAAGYSKYLHVVLLHEIAHVFGLTDSNITSTHSADCVMTELNAASVNNLYNSIMLNASNAYCTSCVNILSNHLGRIYESN